MNTPQSNSASPGGFKDWFTARRFALVLAIGIFALFPDVVCGTQAFFFRDFGTFGYPLAFHWRSSFWRGEIPFWNPYNNCGLPFLAQWNTLVCYPFSLFYILLPLPWSLSFFCLAHLFLGGMGMYFLGFSWTQNRFAAALAGFAFVFNGFTLSCLAWPHCMVCLGWLPWLLWFAQRATEQGGRWMVWAAMVGAMHMLSGMPEFILLTWLVIGAFWLEGCFSGRVSWRAGVLRMTLLVLLIAGLSAFQLLPFFQLLQNSQRSVAFGGGASAMPLSGWANFFVPLFNCEPVSGGAFMQRGQVVFPSYYQSLVFWLLGALALLWLGDRRVRLLGLLILASLVLSMGEQAFAFGILKKVFPGLGFMRQPIKLILPLTFLLPLLGASVVPKFLADADVEKKAIRKAFLAGLIFCSAVIAGVLWWGHQHEAATELWPTLWHNGLLRSVLLALAIGLLCLLVVSGHEHRQLLLSFGLLAVIWLDLATHAGQQNPRINPDLCKPFLGAAEMATRPAMGKSRLLLTREAQRTLFFSAAENPNLAYTAKRLSFFLDCNLLDEIPKTDGFFSLYIRHESDIRGLVHASDTSLRDNLADFLGVSYFNQPGKPFEWQTRSTAMPLLTGGQSPLFLNDSAAMDALAQSDFDPRRTVLLPKEAQASVAIADSTKPSIELKKFSANQIIAGIQTEKPCLIVAAQNFYPAWKAFLDGKEIPIWRANYAFQAIQVPAGRHDVEFVYRDDKFVLGAMVSAVTLIFCALMLYFTRTAKNV